MEILHQALKPLTTLQLGLYFFSSFFERELRPLFDFLFDWTKSLVCHLVNFFSSVYEPPFDDDSLRSMSMYEIFNITEIMRNVTYLRR